MNDTEFTSLRRQQFRRYFQPSRVLLGIFPAPVPSGFNVITLCFSMYCSYRPPMMAVAINDRSSTWDLVNSAKEFVLSVPGPELADASMKCGLESMKEIDKITKLGLELVESKTVGVPGLFRAIANVELKKSALVQTGDHAILVGEVLRFAVNTSTEQRPLLSIGPITDGYELLDKKGVHRLAVVSQSGNPLDKKRTTA